MNTQHTFPFIAGSASRAHEEMLPVLYSPTSPGPEHHYYMIRGDGHIPNVTAWLPGTVGEEYIKAFGHYHVTDFIETYTVIHGSGLLIMQKRTINEHGVPINDSLVQFIAVHMKQGDSLSIPPFWGHGMVNTGSSWLITVDDSPIAITAHEGSGTVDMKNNAQEAAAPSHADYEAIKKQCGFGYYILTASNCSPNTAQPFRFEKNSTYTQLPTPLFFANVNLFAEYSSNTQ